MMNSEPKKEEKTPKRIIHFCDGEVAEYSSDEDEVRDRGTSSTKMVHIDPVSKFSENSKWPKFWQFFEDFFFYFLLQSSLGWVDWLRFKSSVVGNAAINVCDYLGDSLSSFFGITTPKYQFEIDHFNMMKKLVSEKKIFYANRIYSTAPGREKNF